MGFKRQSYYWEIIIMMRKALLYMVSVAFSFDKRLQGSFGMFIIFIAAVMHARRLPFNLTRLTQLESVSLFNTCLTFFLGQFTLDGGTTGDTFKESASAIALISNIAFLALSLVVLVVLVRERVFKTKEPKPEQRLGMERDTESVELQTLEGKQVVQLSADTTEEQAEEA